MSQNKHSIEPERGIYRELTDIMAINPFDGANSTSRKQMYGSHISQALVISNPTEMRIQTGMSVEYGKYTFANKMPENGQILKIIARYPVNHHIKDGFKLTPETIALYESEDGVIGMITLKNFFSTHQHFGFSYARGPALEKLQQHSSIEKGEVFLDSPSKGPNGEYNFGRELNVAYITHPSVCEDGIGISRDVLPHLRFKTYIERTVEWGKDSYPLNLYGDDENYKIFPDIGDYVHPVNGHKGLLMAMRPYDPGMLAVDQSVKALQTLDPVFDKAVYTEGECGRVVDIKIIHQPVSKGESLCDEMMIQPIRYRDANLDFRSKVLKAYYEIRKARGGKIRLTPELHRYIVETMAIVNPTIPNSSLKPNINYSYKKSAINEWRAVFTIEYINTPDIGSKLTCLNG